MSAAAGHSAAAMISALMERVDASMTDIEFFTGVAVAMLAALIIDRKLTERFRRHRGIDRDGE